MKIMAYLPFLAALILIAGCRDDQPHGQGFVDLPAVAVRSMTITPQEGHLQTEVVGTVQPVNQAVIAAKVTGTIAQIPVVLGSHVQAGDLLVNITAGEISAKVIQAQTQLEQARRNLEREQKLLQKNAATPENVKSLEEIYRVAEAAHREATTMLSYTKITAPFDGVVTAKIGNVGDLATPGTPLLRLEDNKLLQVVTSVPETLVLQIQPGDILNVHIPSARLNLQGAVAEIAPAADPLSRTATVKINIDEAQQLRSGQFARVVIPGARKDTLFIPSAAVDTFGQMEKVFVILENRAYLRLVRTGAVVGDQVEVLAGLEPGEEIVSSKTTTLHDGQAVNVLQ